MISSAVIYVITPAAKERAIPIVSSDALIRKVPPKIAPRGSANPEINVKRITSRFLLPPEINGIAVAMPSGTL